MASNAPKNATTWLIEELRYWLDAAEDCVLSDDDAAKIKQGRDAIASALTGKESTNG